MRDNETRRTSKRQREGEQEKMKNNKSMNPLYSVAATR